MSAAIVQDGRIVWERGFGMSDVERSVAHDPTRRTTSAASTATFSAACCSSSASKPATRRSRIACSSWVPFFSNPDPTLRDVLTHRSSSGGFKYDADRYAMLTGAIEACTETCRRPSGRRSPEKIFDRLGMVDSVPGADRRRTAHPPTMDTSLTLSSTGSGGSCSVWRFPIGPGRKHVNTSPSKVMNAATGADLDRSRSGPLRRRPRRRRPAPPRDDE